MSGNPFGGLGGRAPVRRRGHIKWLPILLFLLYLGYYFTANQEQVPITGRSQLVDMSREQEAALGVQSYQQILAEERVVGSGAEVDLVREVGRRIAQAASTEDPGFEWDFNLIDSDQANAFCLPGGKVAVYTGILPIAQNPDGLAVVMGHEIAHAIARHGAERIAHQKLVQIGSMAATYALSDMDYQTQNMVMGALGVGAQYGVLLPFSREHESEADYMGLIYAARACFDPTEAPALWQRMGEASGGQPAEFLSTHPSHETRVRQFDEWMPEALEIRKQFCE
ncbi:MAG: M48 family metalloprotease [Acidobacteria bacterium]|nr:M48 family metalloprotease [Acidobacteriota bacterium]